MDISDEYREPKRQAKREVELGASSSHAIQETRNARRVARKICSPLSRAPGGREPSVQLITKEKFFFGENLCELVSPPPHLGWSCSRAGAWEIS